MLNITTGSRRGRPAHGLTAKTYGTAGLVAGMLACSLVQAIVAPAASGAATDDRSLWVWGSNQSGQMLGDLSGERTTPIAVLDGVSDFAVGDSLGAAVVDGEVWAWGGSIFGNEPASQETSTPRKVPGPVGVSSVAVGNDHALAVDDQGEVWVWGGNDNGQLGLGTTGPATTAPVRLSSATAGLPDFVEVDAGYQYSLALDEAGNVWSWGFPVPYGTGNQVRPQQVAGATGVVELSAGFDHVVARTGSGAVLAWGANGQGQLGQGDTTGRAGVVTVPGLTDATDLAAGERFTLAAHVDGSVSLWGENFGRFLAGGDTNITAPVEVPGLPTVASVGAGSTHALAVTDAGTTYTWGVGHAGLGRDVRPQVFDPVPTQVAGLQSAAEADGGTWTSLVLDDVGTLHSFGVATSGLLGDGYGRTLTPVRVDPPAGTTQMSAGEYHVLARTEGGDVFGWGDNNEGQLGAGDRLVTSPRAIPVPGDVARVVSGWRTSFAIDVGGTVWGWGRNHQGQLGDGTTTTPRSTPMPIDLDHPVVDLDAGAPSTIALDDQGQVWTWGGNSSGELGTGDEDWRLSPFPVPLPERVVDVAMGEEHTVVVDATGTVWTWGDNNRGQLGTTPGRRPDPQPVPGLSGIVSVAAGDAQSLAIDSGGTVWEWGRVLPGRTGTATPTVVAGLPPMSQVSASGHVRLGRSTAGDVWVWGENVEGDLATGDTQPVATPRRIDGFADVASVEVSKDIRNNTLFVLASGARTTSGDAGVAETVATGVGSSRQDPVNMSVTTPVAGSIAITEDPGIAMPGLTVLGVPFDVAAPNASAQEPLVLTFDLHRSAIPAGVPLSAITVARNGTPVADCAAGAGESATPDPCVALRDQDPLGNVRLEVRSSHASTWALVVHTGPPPMPPLVSIAGLASGAVVTLNQNVALTATCQDRGLAVTSCEVPALADTSTVGPHTVVATATDETGAVTSSSVSYTVRYAFSGYDDQVVSPPAVNVGKAGRTYPLGWSLYDASHQRQSSLSAVQGVHVRSVPCGQFDLTTGEQLDASTSGGSGLRIATDGSFAYNWKTPKATGCYRLEVRLADGTVPWLAFSLR